MISAIFSNQIFSHTIPSAVKTAVTEKNVLKAQLEQIQVTSLSQ